MSAEGFSSSTSMPSPSSVESRFLLPGATGWLAPVLSRACVPLGPMTVGCAMPGVYRVWLLEMGVVVVKFAGLPRLVAIRAGSAVPGPGVGHSLLAPQPHFIRLNWCTPRKKQPVVECNAVGIQNQNTTEDDGRVTCTTRKMQQDGNNWQIKRGKWRLEGKTVCCRAEECAKAPVSDRQRTILETVPVAGYAPALVPFGLKSKIGCT